MPDFSRWGANGGDPSLNAIARTDRYLDALASEQPVYATDPADAELADLMGGWRDEVRRPPATGVATQRDAEIILQRAAGARRRTRMSMAVPARSPRRCCALAVSVPSCTAPVPAMRCTGCARRCSASSSSPATIRSRWPRRQMQEVQQLIDQGHWDEAQDKLETITSTVADCRGRGAAAGTAGKQLERADGQGGDAKDPNATLPPASPLRLAAGVAARAGRRRRRRVRPRSSPAASPRFPSCQDRCAAEITTPDRPRLPPRRSTTPPTTATPPDDHEAVADHDAADDQRRRRRSEDGAEARPGRSEADDEPKPAGRCPSRAGLPVRRPPAAARPAAGAGALPAGGDRAPQAAACAEARRAPSDRRFAAPRLRRRKRQCAERAAVEIPDDDHAGYAPQKPRRRRIAGSAVSDSRRIPTSPR